MRKLTKTTTVYMLIFLGLIITACASTPVAPESDYCATKYPLILVHGISLRDRALLIQYWGTIPKVLEKNGAVVFAGGQDAYGVIADNSETLKKRILTVLETTKSRKVNIIAHSRGGIESRYMIHMLGMKDKVASLTTIATPHRGSAMADLIMEKVHEGSPIADIIDFFAKAFGDKNPSSYNAGLELTRNSMRLFNEKVADAPEVYYQSYAAAIDESYPNLIWYSIYSRMKKIEGENDGLVSIESAKWGNYRGLMTCNGYHMVSHLDAAGMDFLTGVHCFKAEAFYRELVHELKMNGY